MGWSIGREGRFSAGGVRGRAASLKSFNHDGLEIARRRKAHRFFPIRQLFYFLVLVVSFKIFLFFGLGASAYGAKIVEMSQGAAWERIAAKAMVLDPVSQWFVDGVRFGRWI